MLHGDLTGIKYRFRSTEFSRLAVPLGFLASFPGHLDSRYGMGFRPTRTDFGFARLGEGFRRWNINSRHKFSVVRHNLAEVETLQSGNE